MSSLKERNSRRKLVHKKREARLLMLASRAVVSAVESDIGAFRKEMLFFVLLLRQFNGQRELALVA